ncbi:MAG: hypothetical protein AAF907_04535 [Planctomycetota bacterium]
MTAHRILRRPAAHFALRTATALCVATALCLGVGCADHAADREQRAEMQAKFGDLEEGLNRHEADRKTQEIGDRADAAAATPRDFASQPIADRLPGTYTRESYGTRTLVVRADGTATMTVNISPLYRWLAGAETLIVEIEWKLTGDPDADNPGVHFESVSGAPKDAFESVSETFGTERDWTITLADEESLVLFDPEDDDTEVWKRIAEPETDPSAAGRPGETAAGG